MTVLPEPLDAKNAFLGFSGFRDFQKRVTKNYPCNKRTIEHQYFGNEKFRKCKFFLVSWF